ncbi:MAG: virulence factor SrfB [Rhodospirillales bacterium]|nr:MAG: virulence factor SrfB [Rhodospirillales bacterium]
MSDLAYLPRYPQPTTLIAKSGVQFLDFGFDPNRLIVKEWRFQDTNALGATSPSPDKLVQFEYDAGTGVYTVMEGGKRKEAQGNLDIGLKDALAPFIDKWIPVPFFQVRPGRSFKDGPSDWARVRLVDLEARNGEGFRDEHGFRYRIVLAFDTGLLPELEGRAYLAPSAKDVASGAIFSLAPRQADNQWFLRQDWVQKWIDESFRELFPKLSPQEIESEAKRSPAEPTARYLSFLGLLDGAGVFPPIKMVGDAEHPGRGAIDVDLVLDVGNSRTCGMLIESTGERAANLNDSYELALRDLTHPERVYAKPFESRIEFAQAEFGKNHLSRLGGRTDAFVWPTMARIGPEATRLAARRRGTEGNTGMSSPKRYLWDVDAQKREWLFNTAFSSEMGTMAANSGPLAQLVNQKGEALHRLDPEDPDNLPVFEPLYSRSSMMTFAMCEIVLQALTQMNSAAQRGRRSHAEVPRRLRRILMTVPTGMPLAERQIFKRRAEAARDLVWMVLGWRLDDWDAPPPEVFLEWDEASCTQLVYLYTEVARNFGGDARAFFQAARKPRLRQDRSDTLRIASLDIGGGTTDLIINTYTVEGAGTSVTIHPEQNYREGFNKAGDDILLRVIQQHVLPPIERALADAGIAAADDLTAELFGGDRGGEDVETRNLRRQFALQVASPIGLALLGACEAYAPLDGTASAEARPFESFFAAHARPAAEVVTFINETARKRGGRDFDLRKVVFPVDLPGIDDTVQAEIKNVLTPLCELVYAYDCDLLLLTGRPSRLPALRSLALKLLPLSPDRVVPLHEYRAGVWYPFRDSRMRVGDPKTTVAVGAMICALGQSQLPGFSFRSDKLKARSTARFIGKIEGAGRMLKQDTYYSNVDLDNPEFQLPESPFEFRGPMTLGFRQMDLERWPTTRLYFLEYASKKDGDALSRRTPLFVTLKRARPSERGGVDVENVDIGTVVDRDSNNVNRRALSLRLQTLAQSEGYWLDTGMLKTV